jgi:hypothetical protein
MAKKILYNWVSFNKKGNLRGFSSGFTRVEAKRLMMRDIDNDLTVVKVDSILDNVPRHFIEGYYHKTSTNNDMQAFIEHNAKYQ